MPRNDDKPASPWRTPAHVHKPSVPTHPHPHAPASPPEQRDVEMRLYGLNAVRATFARRPEAIRKLWLLESRIPQLQPLLKWCAAQRIGYRIVEDADLQKLAASTHHEGIVA